MVRSCLLALGLIALLLPVRAAAQASADREGVRRAALDYIEGFYEGDAGKLRRSIRPDVTKFGFFKDGGAAEYSSEPMSFEDARYDGRWMIIHVLWQSPPPA